MTERSSHCTVFSLTQVPEALRWTVYQWIQQDERKRSGSEIHPKSHGPQAQVRALLPGEGEGSLGHAGCREAGLSSQERGVAWPVVWKTRDKGKWAGAWSPPSRLHLELLCNSRDIPSACPACHSRQSRTQTFSLRPFLSINQHYCICISSLIHRTQNSTSDHSLGLFAFWFSLLGKVVGDLPTSNKAPEKMFVDKWAL